MNRIPLSPLNLESRHKADVRRFLLERLFSTRAVGGSSWSPNAGQLVFASNISGRMNLWLVPSDGGWPSQLTVSEQRQASPAWSPDGRRIAYVSDYDGNEQWDIFLVSPETGEVVNLTHTPDISEEEPSWSPDGRFLAYSVKPRTSSVHEIHVMDVDTRQARPLTSGTPDDMGNHGPRWSPDGRRIAFTRSKADGKSSDIFLVDAAGGEPRLLTAHEGEQTYHAIAWSPAASGGATRLLINSNAADGFENVAVLDVDVDVEAAVGDTKTGAAAPRITWLTGPRAGSTGDPGRSRWESYGGGWSRDGRLAAWETNIDGNTDLFLHDVIEGRTIPAAFRKGVNAFGRPDAVFSPDGSRLLYYYNGPDRPNDIWTCDLAALRGGRTGESRSDGDESPAAGPGAVRQVTHSLLAGIRPDDMVEPHLVHYATFDGRSISAFLYIPYNLERGGSHPAVVHVHGGPAAQSVNSFQRAVQYLVNNGYVVIAPNYRGSTGYGKEFLDLNRFDPGGGDLKDVVQAAKFLETTGYVDSRRIALMGGSYGGYLTMMGVTKTPAVWAAGVAIVPFVNWFTEIEHEDPVLRQYDLANWGDPVRNRALYEDRSPIFFVDRIVAPVLILAGANDPRCPKEESDQVVEAIRLRGGAVEYHAYENEGHGFSRLENLIDSYRRVVSFLDRSMK